MKEGAYGKHLLFSFLLPAIKNLTCEGFYPVRFRC
jgi:hypothetical protein